MLLLRSAYEAADELGGLFGKYGANVSAGLAISDEISVQVGADKIGVLLCLVEVYQGLRTGRRMPSPAWRNCCAWQVVTLLSSCRWRNS